MLSSDFGTKIEGLGKICKEKGIYFTVFLFTGVKADTLVQNAITNVLASTPIFRYIYFHIHVDVIWLLKSESLQGRGSWGNSLNHPYRSPAPMCLITDMNHERVNISVLTTPF